MYEDFKDMVEDVQLVIPSTFEECFTYELQILYLKHLIDNIEPGMDYQEEIDNINNSLSTLQSEVAKLKNDVNNLNPDEVQRKLDAMQTEINGVKASVATLTAEVSAVKQGLAGKQDKLTFDSTPTAGSNNPVTSDGIKKALDNVDVGNVQEQLDAIKLEQTEQNNRISSNKTEIDGVKEDLAGKQNVLTFDSTPTAGSQNPVTSDGIKKALDNVDVGNVQEQLDTIKREQTEQNTKISDNKTAIDSVKESVANQETDITALQETTAGHTTAIAGLQTGKQDKLTFDATPTEGSQNPVTSDGIKKAIDASGGGGGGTGGESQFVEHVFTTLSKVDMLRKDAVVYEFSASGVVRRTDVEVMSVHLGYRHISVYLPKSGSYLALTPARIHLTGIGYADTVIEALLYPNKISVGGHGAFFSCDVNNHLYLVNLKYENNLIIS